MGTGHGWYRDGWPATPCVLHCVGQIRRSRPLQEDGSRSTKEMVNIFTIKVQPLFGVVRDGVQIVHALCKVNLSPVTLKALIGSTRLGLAPQRQSLGGR